MLVPLPCSPHSRWRWHLGGPLDGILAMCIGLRRLRIWGWAQPGEGKGREGEGRDSDHTHGGGERGREGRGEEGGRAGGRKEEKREGGREGGGMTSPASRSVIIPSSAPLLWDHPPSRLPGSHGPASAWRAISAARTGGGARGTALPPCPSTSRSSDTSCSIAAHL